METVLTPLSMYDSLGHEDQIAILGVLPAYTIIVSCTLMRGVGGMRHKLAGNFKTRL